MKKQEEQWLLTEKYGGRESEAFAADCERLKAGEPLAYVIGWVPFLDCKIWLDSRPLIPRPETEFWTEKATVEISATCAATSSPRILDLCAGSGCIGVAVAKEVPEAHVTFAEIDPLHLPTIEKNLRENIAEYSNRLEYYQIVQSDLFKNVAGKYDFILTNPPYIDPALDRADVSVKNFEPHQALYGGSGGMELIQKIVAESPQYLSQHGQLWIEHEPEQTEAIDKLSTTYGFQVKTHNDQFGQQRYSILVLQ